METLNIIMSGLGLILSIIALVLVCRLYKK